MNNGTITPQDRVKIINAYGKFVETHPQAGQIADASALPYPKETILKALLLEIVLGCGPTKEIQLGAMYLADFQPGVGPKPLRQLGFDIAEALSDPGRGARLIAGEEAQAERNRYDEFRKLADKDVSRIYVSIKTAESLWAR